MKAKARPGERLGIQRGRAQPGVHHPSAAGRPSHALTGSHGAGSPLYGLAGVDAREAPSIGHTRAGEEVRGRKVKMLPLTQHRARYQGTGV